MKASELLKKSEAELNNELLASLKELFNLRMQKGAGQLQKPGVIKNVRRGIARIKTVLKQKGSNV
jgi:large subunit ribosomal protein L29